MKKIKEQKLPQFELVEGEITSVTFNFEDSVEFIEKQKEAHILNSTFLIKTEITYY